MAADIHFYFDPVCPFAWMTSKWVRLVQAQRDYAVDWRFISLRLLNAHVDYDTQFPPEYEAGHTAGLRLLRMAARTRAEHGREAVGPLYAALGRADLRPGRRCRTRPDFHARPRHARSSCEPVLAAARAADRRWPTRWTTPSWDAELQAETDEALGLTGKDVGTPILHFEPPDGVAFFGPVISRLPDREQAGRAVGPRDRAGPVPRVRRAEAQPAGAAAAARVRGGRGRGRAGSRTGTAAAADSSGSRARAWLITHRASPGCHGLAGHVPESVVDAAVSAQLVGLGSVAAIASRTTR